MKDFRQSKTFPPYRTVAPLPFLDERGRMTMETTDYSFRYGYMSQRFKARLFNTAQATLESGNEDAANRLSTIANYLTTINVEDFTWLVGSHVRQAPEEIQRAMEQFSTPDHPYDPISSADAIQYSRFGRSTLQLVRVPTIEDQAHDASQLPVSVEIRSNPGPEMLLGFSETTITTTYPLLNAPAE